NTHPRQRAESLGVFRFWRDLGYAAGALVAGLTADWLGLDAALWLVAALTLAAGWVAGWRMR
ncbi:MAG: MFS transporter, partial [Saprospiraceae bacterium]|nr:MFS transporter [Saprospiraceae bacterium]